MELKFRREYGDQRGIIRIEGVINTNKRNRKKS